jgi:inorganic pyrophosphatase
MNIVIETPKGSSEKYDYDPQSHFFKLKKIMPAGMVFPYDFGFIPDTKGEDGDPLDVLVLSEFRSFPGCMMECRLIGAIKAEQTERDGNTVRNDRYLAIPAFSQIYSEITSMDLIPKQMIKELEHFFISYNEIAGKKFEPLGYLTADEAQKEIANARIGHVL